VLVTVTDPLKEPPLVISNTVLSVLAVDYPADRITCYVSDEGAAMLTLETLSETCEFARKWVPFCRKFNIEPRSPECYFSQKVDYLRNHIAPTFAKERRAMKVVSSQWLCMLAFLLLGYTIYIAFLVVQPFNCFGHLFPDALSIFFIVSILVGLLKFIFELKCSTRIKCWFCMMTSMKLMSSNNYFKFFYLVCIIFEIVIDCFV